MDLGDRSRRDGGVVERGEQRLDRPCELGLDQRPRLGTRERWELILQAGEIGCDLLAEEIGSGRQQLAELDEARPQLAECRGEPLARARRGGGSAAPQDAGDPQEGSGGGEGIERKERVVPRKSYPDSNQPCEIAGASEKPKPRPKRVRGARLNRAQRRPP